MPLACSTRSVLLISVPLLCAGAAYEEGVVLPAKLVKRMVRSGTWQRHQCGRTSRGEAVCQLARAHGRDEGHVAASLERQLSEDAAKAGRWLVELLSALIGRGLCDVGGGATYKVMCVCNASPEERPHVQSSTIDVLRQHLTQYNSTSNEYDSHNAHYDINVELVTSADAQAPLHTLHFFQYVLARAGASPRQTLLLTADIESLVVARSLGVRAVLVDINLPASAAAAGVAVVSAGEYYDPYHRRHHNQLEPQNLQRTNNVPQGAKAKKSCTIQLYDANNKIAAAQRFLSDVKLHTARKRPTYPCPTSLSSDGLRIQDNYANFLISELLDDPSFLPMQAPPATGLIRFVNLSNYEDLSTLNNHTLVDIPEDLDDTGIGLSVLHKFGKVDISTINNVLDCMLEFVNEDGILQVYFDHDRPRIDPVVAVNAAVLFHLCNRISDIQDTLRFIESVLLHRAFMDGTLYYTSPESFLYFLSRLIHMFKDKSASYPHINTFKDLVVSRLEERKGTGGNALNLAMRILACFSCEVMVDLKDKQQLADLQNLDGSWDLHPMYGYGSDPKGWIGNQALTTAFALNALLTCSC